MTCVCASPFISRSPYIIEKALGLLPNTEDYTGVKRTAYATAFSRIAHGLARTGDVDGKCSHMLTALKTYPWMVTKPWIWTHMCPLKVASPPRAGQLSLDAKVAA